MPTYPPLSALDGDTSWYSCEDLLLVDIPDFLVRKPLFNRLILSVAWRGTHTDGGRSRHDDLVHSRTSAIYWGGYLLWLVRGLEKFVPAAAYHLCLNLPATMYKP